MRRATKSGMEQVVKKLFLAGCIPKRTVI